MDRLPVLAIVGPTASGKTELAVKLALALGGEVVSADSMQIYRGMEIATAKPSQEEMCGVAHHLLGFLEPEEPFSVAAYVGMARKCMEEVTARGHLPVVAGGTGLYIDSLLQNIQFADMPSDEALRRSLYEQAEAQGAQVLLTELMQVDPETAGALHPNNLGRIVRALEVYHLSSVPISEHRRRSRLEPPPYDVCWIGLDCRNRASLYDRIDRRVDRMLEQGLLAEARAFFAREETKTARQAIGYKELKPYLLGTCSLEEAAQQLKRETRRYAKRQLTWFRRNPEIHWLYREDGDGYLRQAYDYAAIFWTKGGG